MSTLDEFIERLIELRGVAKNGGKTPVTVACESNDGESHFNEFDSAVAEIQNVMPLDDDSEVWICDNSKKDTEQVVNIF